jgi:LPPG:FO 2-phospho-L-lactate transferase
LPVWAVSPIIGGSAVKGPAAKMMRELGLGVSAAAVAEHYQSRYPGLLNGFIIDRADVTLLDEIRKSGLQVIQTDTLMRSRDDKRRLARAVLQAVAQ